MFWEGITPSAPTWFRGSGISAFYPIEDSETIVPSSSHISRLHACIHTYIHISTYRHKHKETPVIHSDPEMDDFIYYDI